MNKSKKYAGIISALMLISLVISSTSVVAEEFHQIKGYVYIDYVSYSGLTVNLTFSDDYGITGYEENNTYGIGAFQVTFEGHTYETCEFKVLHNGNWYTPTVNDSIEIPEVIGIPVNLYINTTIGNQPPGKVEGLTVTDKKDGKLGLSWTAATDDNNNVSKYLIYMDALEVAIVTAPTTAYTNTGLTNGNIYTYRVRAEDIEGLVGPLSDPVSGTPTKSSSGGGSGGGGGGGLPPPSNQLPVADASESQTSGYVDESIDFDGSKSDDPDGTIELYEWDWDNDGTYDYDSTSSTATHTFDAADTYSVTLRVTDNVGAMDTDTIDVIISKANVPPTVPTIEGPTSGTRGTDYTFTFTSTDADNDTIKYLVNWNDGETEESAFVASGTSIDFVHSYTNAGKYTITARANDNETVSGSAQHVIYIDATSVDDIGYLTDDDSDGTYDSFHNGTSGQETNVEKQDDGTYLLDDDGDDSWDWIYDVETDTLSEYSEPTPEPDNTALIVLAIIIILFLIILGYLVKRSNDKKKAAEKKSQPKKENTSKKSKK